MARKFEPDNELTEELAKYSNKMEDELCKGRKTTMPILLRIFIYCATLNSLTVSNARRRMWFLYFREEVESHLMLKLHFMILYCATFYARIVLYKRMWIFYHSFILERGRDMWHAQSSHYIHDSCQCL
jgi:hypothetical protein